ncbi:MAG: glycosyltransferase involved in cell wall biosynthesis [Arenicella sp.]|jgi:glycosyltransferase involved in cell wall biosynthesis
MKVLFLTNQASYHQMHFARAMVAELGETNFRIVFQKPTSAARVEMGWKDDYRESYILRLWQSEAEVAAWIESADVVIQGRFPIKYIRRRIKSGKLTFACQERLWKKRPTFARKLSRLGHFYKNYISVNKPNYHFLAIGSYAAQDLNQLGFFNGRSWQFGYFIDAPEYQARPERESVELLWCARLSAVKQPSMALDILSGLQQRGINAKLTMVGDGVLRGALDAEIEARDIGRSVRLTGWQSQDEVRAHMGQADLFLMTSDHGEGWGLVVNEALSYGCGVVASQELGSAVWLVEPGVSGVLYSEQTLNAKLDDLAFLGRKGLLEMGKAGNLRMRDIWSSKVAAQRTIALSRCLIEADSAAAKQLFNDGVAKFIG